MPRLPSAIAIGLAAALLASCSKPGLEIASPPGESAAVDPVAADPADPEAAVPPAALTEEEFRSANSAAASEITVTGTRIRRPNLKSSVPITVIGSDEISVSATRRAPSTGQAPSPAYSIGRIPDVGRDRFTSTVQNGFKIASEEPVSTFSIDVDTASYSFVRASLNRNVLPQPAAVRTEEMINYFPYDYAAPRSAAQPFSTNVAVFPSPWSRGPQARPDRHQGLCRPAARRGRAPISSS